MPRVADESAPPLNPVSQFPYAVTPFPFSDLNQNSGVGAPSAAPAVPPQDQPNRVE